MYIINGQLWWRESAYNGLVPILPRFFSAGKSGDEARLIMHFNTQFTVS